jgi:hypothetical protein
MGRYKELFQLLESKYGRDKTTYKMGDSITEGGAGWSAGRTCPIGYFPCSIGPRSHQWRPTRLLDWLLML